MTKKPCDCCQKEPHTRRHRHRMSDGSSLWLCGACLSNVPLISKLSDIAMRLMYLAYVAGIHKGRAAQLGEQFKKALSK